MSVLSAPDLFGPVLFCFCHRMFLFRFLELDAASQKNKFIEYEHERGTLMLFIFTAVLLYVYPFSKGYDPDSGGYFLYV